MESKKYTEKGHDLTNPAPFKNLHIQLPNKLKTEDDYTRLFHYMISYFHASINFYSKKYGYGDRQRLLPRNSAKTNLEYPFKAAKKFL